MKTEIIIAVVWLISLTIVCIVVNYRKWEKSLDMVNILKIQETEPKKECSKLDTDKNMALIQSVMEQSVKIEDTSNIVYKHVIITGALNTKLKRLGVYVNSVKLPSTKDKDLVLADLDMYISTISNTKAAIDMWSDEHQATLVTL